MKRLAIPLAALLLALLTLAGCAPAESAPTLETTLESIQVPVAFSGCPVAEQSTSFSTAENATPETARLFAAQGCPAVTLSGVAEEDVTVRFAKPQEEGGYTFFEPNTVMPKLDYRATQGEDALTLQLRTVYNYVITVDTDTGSEYFLVTTQMP